MSDIPPQREGDTPMPGTIEHFRITLTHADLQGPLVMDVPTTQGAKAAVRRAKVTAMHMYHHAPLLDSEATFEQISEEAFKAANA